MSITILHTNDFHGRLTPEKAAFIRALKEQAPLSGPARGPCLYFDSGDCIKSGNLAIPIQPEEAWPLLAQAGCDASTLGNRESHISERAFLAKIKGAAHPLLAANMRRRDGSRPVGSTLVLEVTSPPPVRSSPTPPHAQGIVERGSEFPPRPDEWRGEGAGGEGQDFREDSAPPHAQGIVERGSGFPPPPAPSPFAGTNHPENGEGVLRVGVVGVMVPMVTERMITAAASAFLWDLPIPTALNLGLELRDQVDCLIALTHIGIREDRILAQHGLFDIILGGHSHTILEQPEQIGKTFICQGGCFGHKVGRYVWENGKVIEAELIPLP